MSDFLPFIVIGITTGAVYGLAGVGLVLTYKTSGIFNFAYGAVAALAVFVFYWLHTEHGMPWPYAAALCLFVLSPLEGLVLELVARTLENATATLKVVSTVGILLFMVGVGEIWYGESNTVVPLVPRHQHRPVPRRQHRLRPDHGDDHLRRWPRPSCTTSSASCAWGWPCEAWSTIPSWSR